MTKVAVIGAGLSGLVVARRLQTLADVTVYEKSRGAATVSQSDRCAPDLVAVV